MTARGRHTLANIEPQMGRDLALSYRLSGGFFEDADLVTARSQRAPAARDVQVAAGLDNFTQAVANRLKTRKGELAALGHSDYGSRHHELIGEPNVDRTRNLIKLYVLQALRQEARIAKVLNVTVRAEHEPPRETVRIEISALPIDSPTPVNMAVPFDLGGGR
jgi:phage baseplate assembly protein W